MAEGFSSIVVVSTSMVALISGFLVGVYSIRGYLISPALEAEREGNYKDPIESEESDIDEDDTILDHAPNWTNGEEADRRQGLRESGASSGTKTRAPAAKPPVAAPKANEECKLVLVVRTDLGMTKGMSSPSPFPVDPGSDPPPTGKIAAQCGHATLACYKTLLRAAQKDPNSNEARLLRQWERFGQAKIAVQIKSEDELLELMGKARSLGITAEAIADAGRTQIEPGSRTVLGVGPAPKSEVDRITGHLKLL